MPFFTSSREIPFACPPSPPSNLASFNVEYTLFSPRSRSDIPLSHQSAPLSHLTSWCSGLTALFLFLLVKAALTTLPTAHFVALRPPFPFRQAQFVQVFPLKPAPFCKLSAGLGSTITTALSLFLLSDSRSVLTTLSSPPSFLLPQAFWQELSSFSSRSIRLHWVLGHSFLPENDGADQLARRGALLLPSAIPCSLSPLTSLAHSSFVVLEAYRLI